MHKALIMTAMLAMATGCASQPGSVDAPRAAEPAAQAPLASDCNADGVQSYVGRSWSDSLEGEMRRASDSTFLRLLRPGQVMTMEFNPKRINVVLDERGSIVRVNCG